MDKGHNSEVTVGWRNAKKLGVCECVCVSAGVYRCVSEWTDQR